MRSIATVCALGLLALGANAAAAGKDAKKDGKIPITTSSEEARQSYLKGRDLFEKLRATDARKQYEEALAKDPDFALALVGMANTATTNKEFWDPLNKAVALEGKVSEGEKLTIVALEAGAKGDPGKVKETLVKLIKAYPNDERAHNALAGYYFGQQQYNEAVAEFKKSIAIDAAYSPPYNLLGYALRTLEKYADAEAAFKRYIELIPGDPNPYDSLAELYMKMGRHDESIKSYEKALSIEPTFVSAYVGIANNQMFQNKGEDARKTLAKMATVARTVGEKRTVNFWTSQSYLFEDQPDKALAEMQKNMDLAASANDLGTVAADHAVMGEIVLAAGRADEAEKHFKAQVENLDKASVPPEVKEAQHRGWHYDYGRILLARHDLAGAKAELAEYTKLVSGRKNRFEQFALHELGGLVALEEKKFAQAAKELAQGNQQDPRILYLQGVALQGKGDAKKAKEFFTKAADFNAFGNNYPFVRKLAKDALAKT